MNGELLIERFTQSSRRYHLVGDSTNGVVAGLDLEGRLFTIFNGTVVNRVNVEALRNQTTRTAYLNPGGDGLWPAPEGTRLGYQYGTGAWRVPPGLTGARYRVTAQSANRVRIEAEVDLINAEGRGIPTLFCRDIHISAMPTRLAVRVGESITFLGAKAVSRNECLLAPWTLCQFDCGPGCEVVFPATDAADVWDLYDPSEACRETRGDLVHARTDGSQRYQIGIREAVPWIELHLPRKGLAVRRFTDPLPSGQDAIDIADAPPDQSPAPRRTRYSVYSDCSGFMEIEAAGGCPARIHPECEMSVRVTTEYRTTSFGDGESVGPRTPR